jgi:hypothetical protein
MYQYMATAYAIDTCIVALAHPAKNEGFAVVPGWDRITNMILWVSGYWDAGGAGWEGGAVIGRGCWVGVGGANK